MKLSVLIFTRNDTDLALELAREVYDIADDIVVVDSSGRGEREKFAKKKEALKLKKLQIFHAVALGYPDPLRMYALDKCKGEWVLLIDTDEKLSEGLKENIRTIIDGAKYDAFYIKRYEKVDEGEKASFFTWQIRLFKRSKTTFKGLLHEQATIGGKLGVLKEEGCYLKHMKNLENPRTSTEYNALEKFDRLSYKMHNERVLDYAAKAFAQKDEPPKNIGRSAGLHGVLRAYQLLGLKKKEQEVSNTDYFLYYFFRTWAYLISERKYSPFPAIHYSRGRKSDVERWKKEGEEGFEISKRINEVGIIRFLSLDDGKVINALNKKYEGKRQGIDLLMELLVERYRKGERFRKDLLSSPGRKDKP